MAESATKGMKMLKLNDRDAGLLSNRFIRDVTVEGFDTCSLQKYALKLAIIKHFASCGNILSVCFFKSVAFIRFEGEGAQEKALELDGTDMGGWNAIVKAAVRPINFNYPSRARIQLSELFVTGHDTCLPEIDIKIALHNHFSSCGVVTNVGLTPDGTATITIGGERCVEKALELSGRKVGEMNLLVHTGKRDTEIRKSRRLLDSNACGYMLGSFSRLEAKRKKMEKEEMKKEKEKEMKMKMKMKKEMKKKKKKEMKK